MIAIIKSAPDTPEGKRGIKVARNLSADIVLLQNGVYFIEEDRLEDLGFCRTTYVLEDDRRLRGLSIDAEKKNMKDINYDNLIDLMTESDKVIGMFWKDEAAHKMLRSINRQIHKRKSGR